MTVFWTCLACTTVGDTDKSGEQHTKKTGHATLTSTDPDALARMLDRVTRWHGYGVTM